MLKILTFISLLYLIIIIYYITKLCSSIKKRKKILKYDNDLVILPTPSAKKFGILVLFILLASLFLLIELWIISIYFKVEIILSTPPQAASIIKFILLFLAYIVSFFISIHNIKLYCAMTSEFIIILGKEVYVNISTIKKFHYTENYVFFDIDEITEIYSLPLEFVNSDLRQLILVTDNAYYSFIMPLNSDHIDKLIDYKNK